MDIKERLKHKKEFFIEHYNRFPELCSLQIKAINDYCIENNIKLYAKEYGEK